MIEDQEYNFLKAFEALKNHPSQQIWDEYNHLRLSLFSLRYNYIHYKSHRKNLLNSNIIDSNGSKRWHQQKITFTLIGNFLTSFQSGIERFAIVERMTIYRNSIHGQLMAVLRNYHLHKRTIDPILSRSMQRIGDEVIEDDEEFLESNKLVNFLNEKIKENRNTQRSKAVREFIRTNYESRIPLMSIFDENYYHLEKIIEKCLISFIKRNKKSLTELLNSYDYFLKNNKTENFNYIRKIIEVKHRYLKIGERIINK